MNNSITIFHWNCNSIYNKQDIFYSFLNIYKPDIICLNETKLGETRARDEIYIKNHPHYHFFHKHRSGDVNGAGGVAIMIRKQNNFIFELDDTFDFLNLELLSVKIKTLKKEFTIISYYKPLFNLYLTY